MSSQPRVGLLMLMSPGRERYQVQAVRDAANQTYPNCKLIAVPAEPGVTIGEMRNRAIELAADCDIIAHWDDDDRSHPCRIEEQVGLLSFGCKVVGYNVVQFIDVRTKPATAWIYRNQNPRYAIGASLCYWRRVWEQHKFQHLQHGEDTEWIRGLDCVGVSGFGGLMAAFPRLVARIHGGNSSSAYDPIEMARHAALPAAEANWSRDEEVNGWVKGLEEK